MGKEYLPIFRGVQEIDGDKRHLVPSLERFDLVKYEFDLINELKRQSPNEFDSLKGLNLLGKCQHFGLPTRLLDFTLNQNVALFFACKKIISATNKVYCLNADLSNESLSEDISNIPQKMRPWMYDLVLNNKNEEENAFWVEDIIGLNNDKAEKDKRIKDFVERTLVKPIYTYPKFYAMREKNQESVFMIFSNEIEDMETSSKIDLKNRGSSDWKSQLKSKSQKAENRFVFIPKLFNPFESVLNVGNEQKINFNSIDDWEIFINEANVLLEIIVKGEPNQHVESLQKRAIDLAFLFPEELEYTVEKVKQIINERKMQ